MADKNTEITRSIETIRTAIYGKDVRESIAHGIELCYDYVGGQAALDAAIQAQEAIGRLETVVEQSEGALDDLGQAVNDAKELVVVSQTQPTNPKNKVWIKPQADQEFKIATFDAYAVLWNHVDELNETYNKGHGGIESIELDTEYVDETEEDIPAEKRLNKRYAVNYSDGYVSYIYVKDGATGLQGPPDYFSTVTMEYVKGTSDSNGKLVTTPPDTGWSTDMPKINPGEWLWARTINRYTSGEVSYIYSVSRSGIDGAGSMNNIRFGQNGTVYSGDVTIPIDTMPTQSSTNVVLSGAVYSGIIDAISNLKQSPAFLGTPTAPTAAPGTNTTQIATTAFVDNAVANSQINTATLFASPAFTGVPTAPTADTGTNTIQVATTAFVQTAATNAALNAVGGLYASHLSKESDKDKSIYIGVPPGSRHFVIFSGFNVANSAVFIVQCNDTGAVSILTLGAGAKVAFTPNYGSSKDCSLQVTVSAVEVNIEISDFVLYRNESKTPTLEDASLKDKITDAQAFL